MRGDLIVYLEHPQLGRRQPCKSVVYIAREDLPRRSIVQFDDVAFGMLHDSHAMACRKHNKRQTVMLAKSSDPCAALKCRSTSNAAVQSRGQIARSRGTYFPQLLRHASGHRKCHLQCLMAANSASIEPRSRLPGILLENSLHNAGADAELLADLEDAITAGPQL
jgi:hypothetical protein